MAGTRRHRDRHRDRYRYRSRNRPLSVIGFKADSDRDCDPDADADADPDVGSLPSLFSEQKIVILLDAWVAEKNRAEGAGDPATG